MDVWNPVQYEKFKIERAQPFWDLARTVDFRGVSRMLDIGCGTGELTRELHVRENVPHTLGIDSSAKMLAQSPSAGGLEFRHSKVEDFAADPAFDIVISNAALQWVENHRLLFPKILGWVRTGGGQLAIQMPFNHDHPSHLLADEMGARYGLKARSSPVLRMEDYAALFAGCGVKDLNISTKIYLHPMPAAEGVVDWVKGSYLTHFEKQLEPARFAEFLSEYAAAFTERIGDGPYLYTFKRMFIHARI